MSFTVNVDDGVTTAIWDVAVEVDIDPVTGVGTMTFTPRGGRARLPGIIDGAPGLPPIFDPAHTTVVVVAPGDTVPAPVLTPISPGGPGVASVYGITYYVPKGDTGASVTTILSATDISGTVTAKYQLVVNDTGDGITFAPVKVGGIYAGTLSSTSGNASPRILGSVAIAGQLSPWRPKVSGFVVVGNAADTHVDLFATVGNGTSDDQIAYGPGVTGSTVHPVQIGWAGWGASLGTTGGKYGIGYGAVPAGQATTVFLQAKQTASTTSNWTTPATGPTAAFAVEVSPIP